MVVHPIYYSKVLEHGADSARPKVVVFFGAYAPRRTEQLVDFVVICGHNDDLQAALADVPHCLLEGFIPAQRIREHFSGAACVIGKPGPGSVSEAAVCKVPFLAQRQVMPQEECVLEWLQRSRAGIVVDDFKALPLDFLEQVRA